MPLQEIVFQVEIPDLPIAQFTRENPGAKLIFNHVAFDEDHFPVRQILTIVAAPAAYEKMLYVLPEYYDDVKILRRDDRAVSVILSLKGEKKDILKGPYEAGLKRVGSDMILRPTVVKDGWMTIGVITVVDVDIGSLVREASEFLKSLGVRLRLMHFGEYKPEESPIGDYEEKLTPKQTEIIKMALALGLYDTPRQCSLDTLAEIFGISKAAAHNRMKAAEKKILSMYFT
jgi:predicted DNA binding protein